ncbi:MAG: ABC transporter substrate-binding protein [Acidimicrobiales bacterium]|nr:ABC transporter substrate-binding protein [Acidimicrobiales bacterium]
MKSTNRLWRILALLLAFTLVAAACGDDDDTNTGSGDDAGDDAGDDGGDDGDDMAEDDAGDDMADDDMADDGGDDMAADDDMADDGGDDMAADDDMADDGGEMAFDLEGRTVSVGVENAYLPFNYVPVGGSEGEGWDYDAWREICRLINCVAEFVVAGWPDVIDQVAQGELDTAADGISITPERAEIVAYSQAYMTVDQKFIKKLGDDRFNSADDVVNSDALVGTQVGTTNYELAESLVGADRISAYDQFGVAVQALIAGDVDVVIIDDAAGQGYVGENADQVELVDDALQADPLGFIFPQDTDLIPAVDYAIDQMRESGFLQELGEKYFTDAFSVTYDDIEG